MRVYFILTVVIFIFYGNSLLNGFVYDDPSQIQNNLLIQNFSDLPKVVGGCLLGIVKADCNSAGLFYRPMALIVNLLTNQISHQPWVFHLRNIIFFFLVAVLAFELYKDLFGKTKWAVFAVLLFVINPINSEVVNFVSAVHDTLFAMFSLLMLLAFIRYLESKRPLYLIFSVVCYFFAIVAKETGLVMFFLLPLYQLIFKRRNFRVFALYIVPVILYYIFRNAVLVREAIESKGYHDLTVVQSFFTAVSVFPIYISKLIFPWSLNAQADPLIVRYPDGHFLIGSICLAAFFAFVYFLYKRKIKVSLFGAILIILPLIPTLLFINRVGRFIFAERWLYIPSLGFSLILVDLVEMSLEKAGLKKKRIITNLLLFSFCFYFLFSFWVVFNRNPDWKDEFSLNKSIGRYSKDNFGVFYNLGVNYKDLGENQEAAGAFLRSVSINPDFWQAHYNLGWVYLSLNKLDLASSEYQNTLDLNPQFAPALFSLENVKLLQSATASAKIKLADINKHAFLIYNANWVSFTYPISYKLVETGKTVKLLGGGNFTIEIAKDILNQPFDDYFNAQKIVDGELINQGRVQIQAANFDEVYVKVYKVRENTTLNFFLHSGKRVIKVLVFPEVPEQDNNVNFILGSLRIVND